MNYSEVLTKIRAKQGWDLKQLAENLGISQRLVAGVEARMFGPSRETAVKIRALMDELKIFECVDGTDADNGYDVVIIMNNAVENDEMTKDDHVSAGYVSAYFWHDFENNRMIKYNDMLGLKKLLSICNIDEARFFACCAVNPVSVIDKDGATEALNIKLFHDLLRLEMENLPYTANLAEPSYYMMLSIYDKLNDDGRKRLLDNANDLVRIEGYTMKGVDLPGWSML
ncbi:hypothetical protein R80B4_00948 [Fibrobacteres bacterium R8-0-B4]